MQGEREKRDGERGDIVREKKRREGWKRDGERGESVREKKKRRRGEKKGVKGKETERARKREGLIGLVIFKAPLLSIVWRRNKEKREKFTPISKSLTSFLTDVVSALLFN